jgi:predicted regulator of Ras-like GTPase activity (Roadblock/LC7/MglB family)
LRQISDRLGGVRGIALVAQDGIPVESYGGSADLELEMLCAELLDQVRVMNEDHRDLQAGAVEQLTLVTDRVSLVVSRLSPEYYLLAALPADAPAGRARFELRRAQLLFEDDLA